MSNRTVSSNWTQASYTCLLLRLVTFDTFNMLHLQVYFNAPNMKVFDVVLNGDLTVNSDLDIFEKVGRGVAHDEYVEFSVESNKIIYQVMIT